MTAGNRIRALRESRGWSLTNLTDLYNQRATAPWHRSVLAKVETNQRSLAFEEAGTLADVLGVTLDELRGEETDREADAARAAFAQWQRTFAEHAGALQTHASALSARRERAPGAPWHPDFSRWIQIAQDALRTIERAYDGVTYSGSGTVDDPYVISRKGKGRG